MRFNPKKSDIRGHNSVRSCKKWVLAAAARCAMEPLESRWLLSGLTIFVDGNATTGADNGTSWSNAYTNLPPALAAAQTTETASPGMAITIDVAQGTYYPTAGTDRTATFQLEDDVSIYGGFVGAANPNATRNVAAYPTILSGQIGPEGTNSGNSYHVVSANGVNSTAILDGFTMSGGNANGTGSTDYGGGLQDTDGSPTVNDCTFISNDAGKGGGAVDVYSSSSPTFTNCIFTSNTAEYGGAVYVDLAAGTFSNCTFSLNAAITSDGAGGGAMEIDYGSPTIEDCTFSGNAATSTSTTPQYATGGAGVYVYGSGADPAIINSVFVGNVTSAYQYVQGGAIAVETDADPVFTNCTITANQTVSTVSGSTFGGGIFTYDDGSTSTLTNCILWNNNAINGTSVYQIGGGSGVTNTTYSDVDGGYSGAGNISTDPQFIRNPTPGPEGVWGTLDDDYGNLQLSPSSPCIDIGSNAAISATTTDLAGNPRIVNRTVDLGAYEFQTPVVTWVGSGDGMSWSDPNNWSSNAVPGSSDDVVIDAPGITVNISANETVENIVSTANLNISGGLGVTLGTSSISGSLLVANGAYLSANGSGTSFTANGTTTVNGASLYASSGATLSLPNATSYVGAQNTIEASGTGSQVLLASLASIQGGASFYTTTTIEANDGGDVELPAATQAQGGIDFEADGTGSLLDLATLTGIQGSFYYADTGFYANNGGTIQCPDLIDVQTANITVDATSTMNTGQIVSYTGGGTITANGTDPDLHSLTTLNGISLIASAGGMLSIPKATTYVGAQNTIEASGTGSQILLESLASIQGGASFYTTTTIEANDGGDVELPSATQAQGGIDFEASGTGSLLDLATLAGIQGSFYYADTGFYASNGGTIQCPDLTNVQTANITVDATSTMNTGQIVSYTGGGTITANGTDPDLHSLTTLAGNISVSGTVTLTLSAVTGTVSGSLDASSGAMLSLPNATSYVGAANTIEASGTDSQVLLASLASIQGGASFYTTTTIEANDGGDVELPAATQAQGGIDFEANGTGSLLDLPTLADIQGSFYYADTGFYATNGGTIQCPDLTDVQTANITVDATSSMNTSQIVSYTDGGTITANGTDPDLDSLTILSSANLTASSDGIISLPNLTGINDASGIILAENGGTILLPNVTSYSASGNTTIEASGIGSQVLLPALMNMEGTDTYFTTTVEALDGGQVQLPAATQAEYALVFEASGTGSLVNLPLLASFQGLFTSSQTGYSSNSGFYVSSGGTIDCPELTTITTANLSLDSTSLINTAQIVSYNGSGGTFTDNGAMPDLSALTSLSDVSLLAENGGTFSLPNLTSYSTLGNTLEASGAGSQVVLSALTTIQGTDTYFTTTVEALGGGQVQLPAATQAEYALVFEASGAGSLVNLPLLASFQGLFTSSQTGYSSNSGFYVSDGGTIDCPDLSEIQAANISSSTSGTLQFAPELALGSGTTVTLSPTGILETQLLQLNPGSVLDGSGSLIANLTNTGGTVSPASSGTAGSLTIQGNYTQATGSFFQVDVGGTTAGSTYDQLVVTGTATLAGTLQLGLINGYFPATGNKFTPVTAASVTGQFTTITGGDLGQNIELDPAYSSTAVTLSANIIHGPYVIATSFAPSLSAAFSSIDFTFNKPLNAQTFIASQITFSGPGGAISISSINQLSADQYQVNFATQNTPGKYQISLGTGITDASGDGLDQTQTGTSNGYSAAATLDLAVIVPESVSATSSSAQFGGLVTLHWTDQNSGNIATSGGGTDEIYLSTSQTLNASSVLIGTESLPLQAIGAGGNEALSDSATLPAPTASLPAGTYFIVIRSAASGNSAASSAIQISEPLLPDLDVSSVTAPIVAIPNQAVTVNWNLANTGDAAASGPWTEQILYSADAAGDNPTLVETLTYTGTLAAGGNVARSTTVQLPAVVSGNVWFVVTENPDGQLVELNSANNTAVASGATAVSAALTLTLSTTSASNAAGADAATGTLTRNGSTAMALSVTLANSDPTDVSAPSHLTIPAGQSSITFDLGTIDSGVVRGTQSATLTASATGLLSSSTQFTVTDVNVPTLSISISTTSVNETAANPAATATITTNDPSNTPLVVTLLSNTTSKLTAPATVTIPAGQTSVTVPLTVIQDDQIVGDANVTLTATATGFADGTAEITVVDTNLPTLSLSLADTSISQSAGADATTGTVTFSQTTVAPMIIFLTSSNTSAATVPTQILVQSGESSVSFQIAAVNDGLDQGNQSVTITAEIITIQGAYLASTKTSTLLTVVNSNGPALAITLPQAAIAAGGNELGTVTRNTSTSGPLIVTLLSSNTSHATVPQTVTIPGGQASATFLITGIDDGLADGEQYSQISASATGLAEVLVNVGVTTVDLPDLTVSNVTAPTSGFAGSSFQVSWTVLNNGMYAASGPWSDEVFFDPVGGTQSSIPADTVTYTGSDLDPGATYTQSDTLTLPTQTGAYNVRVVTDADQSVEELSFNNNTGTSAQPLNDQAPYHATVSTSITTPVPNGTSIPLFGQATYVTSGQPAANIPVGIFISVDGTTRELQATTDSNGNYSTVFQPLQYEAGQYSVGADYPGATSAATQATFQIVGLTATPATGGTLRVVPNTPLSGTFTLNNLSNTPLTGLTATVVDAASDLTIKLTAPSSLSGLAHGTLSYSITSSGANGAESSGFYIQVTTNEGAIIDIPVAVNVVPVTPQLVANPGYLNVGMLVGGQTLVSFQVTNTGGAPTGNIQVDLPSASYLSLATPATLPSLAPGASTTVTLLLSPAADLALEQYTGSVAVKFTGGGVSVPFIFQAISGEVGTVQVLVDDDFTFTEADAPRVAGATVTLLNPYDNSQIVASGTTDSTGQVTLTNVPAGPYTLQVQAAGHSSYQSSYTVTTGITNTDEVFLSNQLVTYTWQVVPTEIQDQYTIQLQTTFATDVPAPVVTISGPASVPTLQGGQSAQIDFTLTNHGLIAAQQVVLNLPTDPEYTFAALTTNIGTIPAGSSVTVPVTVSYEPISQSQAAKPAISGPTSKLSPNDSSGTLDCTLVASDDSGFVCGDEFQSSSSATTMNVPGRTCNVNAIMADFNGAVGGGAIITPTGYSSSPSVTTPVNCVKCLKSAAQLAVDILIDVATDGEPIIGGILGLAADNAFNEPHNPVDVGALVLNGAAGANSVAGGIKSVSKTLSSAAGALSFISQVETVYEVLENCFGISISGFSSNAQLMSAISDTSIDDTSEIEAITNQLGNEINAVTSLTNVYSYFFGSSDWLATSRIDTLSQWVVDFFTDTEDTPDGSIDASDAAQLLATTLPDTVTQADATEFINRWNRTISYFDQGITTTSQVPAGESTDFIDQGELNSLVQNANNAILTSQANGYSDPIVETQASLQQLVNDANNQSVCASIQLQINQTATLTRNAFSGTLDITNSQSAALTNIQLVLNITDANGNPVNGEFYISSPTFAGSLTAVDGTGVLPADASGTVSYTFIPDEAAAANGPTVYNIGGTLNYTDPVGGNVSINIYPSTITVYPQPEFQINYFLQQDVIGEDPSQPDVNIPSEPATLGMLVTNVGGGTANDLSITTAQPQIVENEKGLLDTFEIIGTQVGTQQVSPSLTVDLGDIDPGQTADADFLLTSSLQGIFTNFSATFTHSDALGGLDTSLISSVVTHDLVHAGNFNYADSTGEMDYLADDTPNTNNLPDTIYFSDGTTAPVNSAGNAQSAATATPGVYQVTASVTSGWDYLELPDPGAGYTLYKVVRSDGTVIPVSDQAWTTDRTFSPDGKSTVDYELHVLDDNSTGSYTVYYKPTTAAAPAVTAIQNISSPQSGAVSSVMVTFNEAIDASTFTANNVSLTLNGGSNLVNSAVTITQSSPTTFTLGGLSGLTAADGNYILTINASGINDGFGDIGYGSQSETWATGTNIPVVVGVGAGNPLLLNTAISSVDVVLSETIVASSFGDQNLSLTLNGGGNLINSGVTVTPINSTSFEIDGLQTLTQAPGTYVLTVDAAGMVDAAGNQGVGSASETWTVDTTPPTVVSVGPMPQSPRNIIVPTLDVTFSKPIDPSTLTYTDFTFSKDGGANLITSSIVITQLSATEFEISNFENLVSPIDGTYTFTVNAAGVFDLAGNAGTGSASQSWELVTSPPPAPTNLNITPLVGVSGGNDVTISSTVLLTGSLGESGLVVQIFEGQTDLGLATVSGTTFSESLSLASGENALTIEAVDQAGNISPSASINIFVDNTPPTAAFSAVAQSTPQQAVPSVQLTFAKAIDPATLTDQALSLSLNGGPNLITSGVTITNVGGNTYEISGLQALDSAPGQYLLSLNTGMVEDLDGNLGVGNPSASWQVLPSVLPAAFGDLTLPSTIAYGTSVAIVSGTISGGSVFPTANEFVAITLNGVTINAPINAQGGFAASFDTSTLLASSTPYQITYSYAGDSTLSNAFNSSSTALTVPGTNLILGGSAFYLKVDADGQHVDEWANATGTGTPVQTLLVSQLAAMIITGTAGNTSLTIDFSNGDPLGNTGLTFTGVAGYQNVLNVIGTTGNDTVTINGTTVTESAAFGSATITYGNLSAVTFNGGTGSDVLTQTAQPAGGATLAFIDTTADDTLNVDAGTFTFAAAAVGSGIQPITLGTLFVGDGAQTVLATSNGHPNRTVLELDNLSFAATDGNWTGALNLNDNDMIIHNGNLATVTSQIKSGLELGGAYWQGPGLDSSAAADDPNHSTALGVLLNNDGIGNPLYGGGTALGLFDGVNTVTTDILVKYTYFGDTNLDGHVDASDYLQIDNASSYNAAHPTTPLTGWSNGDFNYDGSINGSDYTLMDNAFNSQAAPLSAVAPILTLPAAPTLTYDGTSDVTSWVVATFAGVVGKPAPTGGPKLQYFNGSSISGSPLASPPQLPGTYTVVASYAGDEIYAADLSNAVTFTINRAAATVTLTSGPSTIKYDGTSDVTNWVKVYATGISGAATATGTVTPIYYSGPSATGTPLTSSPINVGTYTVVAAYSGDSNYLPSDSSPITFTISATTGAQPLTLSASGYYLKLDTDGQHLDVWNGDSDLGTPNQSLLLSSISSIVINGTAGGTVLTVDFSNGDPLVPSGVSFIGVSGVTNTLNIVDTGDASGANFNVSADTISVVTSAGTTPITYTNTSTINILPGLGIDTLTQSAQPGGGASLAFVGTTTNDYLNVNGGTFTFPALTTGTGITTDVLGGLSVAGGAKVAMALAASSAHRQVLILDALSIASSGQLDLGNNDLVLKGGGLSGLTQINNLIKQGANIGGSYWNGNGVASSAAAATNNTALGFELNNNGSGGTFFSMFDGQSVTNADVLVKYTYYGDAELTGTVTANDYLQIDNTFNYNATHPTTPLTGWNNGDFNYDGFINGDDYTLIDNAYNSQGSVSFAALPASQIATNTAQVAKTVDATILSNRHATPAASTAAVAAAQDVAAGVNNPAELRKKHRNLWTTLEEIQATKEATGQ